MSCNNVPSKVDVMGWNQQSLADYMRKVSINKQQYKCFSIFNKKCHFLYVIWEGMYQINVS